MQSFKKIDLETVQKNRNHHNIYNGFVTFLIGLNYINTVVSTGNFWSFIGGMWKPINPNIMCP